jgi:dihydrodipicolinate synthase/N-acetylneuraminate lyase
VSSTANVVPELFLAIYDNVRKGELKKAWKAQEKLCRACALFHYGALVARYKEGLRLRGFDPGHVRPPQRELTSDERKAFTTSMKKSGLI